MPGEVAITVSPPPASLRWVVPATIVCALMVLGLMLKLQHNHVVPLGGPGPAAVRAKTADVPELLAWLDHAAPIVASLRAAFDDVGEAAQASDFVGTSTACSAGLDLSRALDAELPSPDIRLNTSLSRALDDYDEALRHCVSGIEKSDASELAMAGYLVAMGDQHWRDAVEMGDTPWPGLPPKGSEPSHVFKT